MTKRLFLTDLDGTLLNKESSITDATRQAVTDYISRDNYFAICTGRALPSGIKIFNSLNISSHNCFVVGYNGSQIYDCEKEKLIYNCTLSNDITEKLFDLADEFHIHLQAYNNGKAISRRPNEHSDYYSSHYHTSYIFNEDIISALTEPTCKVMLIEPDETKVENFFNKMNQLYGDQVKGAKCNTYYYDIFNKVSGKGAAVERLCEYLELPIEASVAAGDEINDLEMLQVAHCSIAMINGCDAVKAAASFITEDDNDHNGLVPFFNMF